MSFFSDENLMATADQPNDARIHILSPEVINKIAAGEVIQQPVNCIKEMVENSLDAKCTSIQILVKNGGLKFISVQDDGIGIHKEDLPIVCRRWTTSKLGCFEDLRTIGTYGFRGEALASISYVAHVTITTMKPEWEIAYRATYSNGELVSRDGGPPECRPTCGIPGTQIVVEDLFYNIPYRLKSINSREEYAKISDLVSKYAVHNSGISFTLKKLDDNRVDISTKKSSTISENIRQLFGIPSKNLLHLESEQSNFKLESYISLPNYSGKSNAFILFINHRLVENNSLKKAIKSTYSLIFGKVQMSLWIYMSILIDPLLLDVNVHPSKIQVLISNEHEIIPLITKIFSLEFSKMNSFRELNVERVENLGGGCEAVLNRSLNFNASWNVNRKDPKEVKLDRYMDLGIATGGNDGGGNNEKSNENNNEKSTPFKRVISRAPTRNNPNILSVGLAIRCLEKECHQVLHQFFINHSFVGYISSQHILLQYNTGLYLCDIHEVSKELIFQETLHNLGEMPMIKFEKPASIFSLLLLALSHPHSNFDEKTDGNIDLVASRILESLQSHSQLLKEYFSIVISKDGYLESIPEILSGYMPEIGNLALFVLRLHTEISWENESETLIKIARELGNLYSIPKSNEYGAPDKNLAWKIEHQILNFCRIRFFPPYTFAQNLTVIIVAQTHKLYKIFERC